MPAAAQPLPWHQTLWDTWSHIIVERGPPHALLLTGESDIGKEDFAMAMAQLLLCQKKERSAACGNCSACHLSTHGQHPDFIVLGNATDKQIIGIDEIRAIHNALLTSAHQGGWQVILIKRAHTLGAYAANALLKHLEEPQANTCFLLLSDMPFRLPATIHSRCQRLNLTLPDASKALSWLEERIETDEKEPPAAQPTSTVTQAASIKVALEHAEGKPLLAHAMHRKGYPAHYLQCLEIWGNFTSRRCVVSVAAEQLIKVLQEDALDWVLHWLVECAGYISAPQSFHSDIPEKLTALKTCAEMFSQQDSIDLIDKAMRARSLMLGPSNPNLRLLLENLFAECMSSILNHGRQHRVA
jgi:DNA polymerase-3 subunit delta'